MDTSAIADLSLAVARFIERTVNTWECHDGCDPNTCPELLDLLVARLHHGCVEPVWSSSVQVDQADLQPSIAHLELCESFPNCLAAIAHFTSNTIPMGFTNSDGSQTGASTSKEASKLRTDKLECSTTSVLRCALVQAHICTCMQGISPYSGSRIEAVSWRCFTRIIDFLVHCAQNSDQDITLPEEDERLCTSWLQTLLPALHQAAGDLKQRRAGRAACGVLLAIASHGVAYQHHIAALLLLSDFISVFFLALQHNVRWKTQALDLLFAMSPYMTSGDLLSLRGLDGFKLIGQFLQVNLQDGDGVEPHCTTSGDTQGNHVARQLLTVRAAAEILTAIVDANDKCGSSLSKSRTQVTGPSYFANQIERHVEASVLALRAIQYVQSVKTQIGSETHPAVEKAVGDVIPALQNLLLKVLLPHLADPAANMIQVYHDGLPVLLACLRDSPADEDKLDCLIEALMDRMVNQNDFTLPKEETTSDRLLQAILFMVEESPANQASACVAKKPIILHMIWVLLSHKWITDFMCNSPPEYVEELVYCLQDVWQAVSRSGPLELKLLTAACWLKAQKDKAVLDCEDALTSNMVVFCLQSTYGLVNIRPHWGITECLAAGRFMSALAPWPHASAICAQVGCNLKACLGFLDRIPSITHLASMRDVLVEGAVAMLHVIPRATDGSLPEEYIDSHLEAGGLKVCAYVYMHYPSACPSWAKEANTPELRPHRTVGTRLKSPMVILARLMGCAAYCLELGSTKGDVQSFFKHCFGNMVETARDIVALEGMKLPAAGLEQNFDRLPRCHILRWGQAKYRGPAPPCGFARASIAVVIDILLSMKTRNEIRPELEWVMEEISRLYSHAAWQAQFCEMQRSEQPDHLAIKAALRKLVMDVTSAKLLPDHVSKAITACFLVSEVQEASANAAAAQLLAEEANAVKQAKSKKAKKERQKAKKQQQQQQQQSIMQALQNEAAQTEVPGKPQELEDANRGDAVVQQAVQGLTGKAGLEKGVEDPKHKIFNASQLECSDGKDGQSMAGAAAVQPRFSTSGHASLNLFCCPLSQVMMQDPVIAADGHTYERHAMQQWLHDHSTSPVTGQQLRHLRLLPNIVIKSAIRTQQEG